MCLLPPRCPGVSTGQLDLPARRPTSPTGPCSPGPPSSEAKALGLPVGGLKQRGEPKTHCPHCSPVPGAPECLRLAWEALVTPQPRLKGHHGPLSGAGFSPGKGLPPGSHQPRWAVPSPPVPVQPHLRGQPGAGAAPQTGQAHVQWPEAVRPAEWTRGWGPAAGRGPLLEARLCAGDLKRHGSAPSWWALGHLGFWSWRGKMPRGAMGRAGALGPEDRDDFRCGSGGGVDWGGAPLPPPPWLLSAHPQNGGRWTSGS